MAKNPDSLAKKSLILIFAQVIVNIASVAQAMILARLLVVSANGTYLQVVNITGYYVILALGLPESITYFIARSKSLEDKVEKQSTIMTMSLALSVFIIVLFTAADGPVASFYKNPELIGLGPAIGLIFVGNMVQLIFQNTSVVTEHVRDAATMSISYSIGNLAVIASLFFYRDNIKLFIYVLAAYNLLMAVLRVVTMLRYFNFRIRLKFDTRLFKDILAFGLPICISTMIGTISRNVDKTIVAHYFTLEESAYFSQAAKELPYSIVTGAIVTVLMPKIIESYSNGTLNQSLAVWKKGVVSSSYLAFFAIATNILLAREIVIVLYSEKYLPSVPVFIVYTLLLVSRITYWGMFLQAMRKPRIVMYVAIFSLVANIALNFAFIPLFGTVGSALATIVTSYASVAIYIRLNCKYLNVKAKEMIPFGKLGAIIAVNAVAYVLFWALKTYLLDTIRVSGKASLNSLFEIAVIGGLWAAGYALVFRKDLAATVKSLRS